MANMCYNQCRVSGSRKNINELFQMLSIFSDNALEGHCIQADYRKGEEQFMFDVSLNRDDMEFSFDSRWVQADGAVRALSKEMDLFILHDYTEYSSDLIGRAEYHKGEQVYDICIPMKDFDLYEDNFGNYRLSEFGLVESRDEYYGNKLEALVEEKIGISSKFRPYKQKENVR